MKVLRFINKIFLLLIITSVSINAQWELTTSSGITEQFASSPTLAAGGSYIFIDGAYRSSNKGDSWETITPAIELNRPTAQYYFDGKLISGHNSSGNCILYSDDNGETWNGVEGGPVTTSVYGFLEYDGVMLAYSPKGVYRSEDSGLTWTNTSGSIGVIVSMIEHNNNLFLITTSTGVFKSTDGGVTWNESNNGIVVTQPLFDLPGEEIWSLGNSLYFLNQAGKFYESTDNGENWSTFNANFIPRFSTVESVTRTQSGVYIRLSKFNTSTSTNEHSLFYGNDASGEWTNITGNLPIENMGYEIVEYNGYLFVSYWSSDDEFFRRNVTSVTSVKNLEDALPNRFTLEQNYPNPFNPSTKIQFSIPSQEHVSLKIYDALGREVKNIINANLAAGSYSLDFDASRLSSGVYYYRVEAGSFVQMKKMILTK